MGDSPKIWVLLTVETGQEDLVCQRLQQRITAEGLQNHFGEMERPYERVAEIKDGKRRVSEASLPGLMLEVTMDHCAWSLVRQTPGVEKIELI